MIDLRDKRKVRQAAALGAAVLMLGCAALPPPAEVASAPSDVAACAALFAQVDAAVAAAGVGDAQSVRVAGLPYLRLDRFLGNGLDVPPQGPAFEFWVDRLRALDREARRAELANLPAGIDVPRQMDALDRCATRLRQRDLAEPGRRQRLLAARVADDYRPLHRLAGLYPLTSQPFLLGVHGLHRETEQTFATPLAELPVHGRLRRFAPAVPGVARSHRQPAAMLQRAADNPLRLPLPDAATLAGLFAAHAPVLEIDVASSADLPGQPQLGADGTPRVGGEPRVYTLTSLTRWQGETLLQLNYVVWFPARPRQGPFDLVGGPIDGITWRVTLGRDGRPLLYDSMHNCGCYYKALPTAAVRVTERYRGWQEPISVPQQVPDGDGRLVLRLAATSHYLERVYRRDQPADTDGQTEPTRYQLADYHTLRSLPLPGGGRRSFFRSDGIVAGSERRERWLFWPMGVPEPGAMRQWGNHAIAFVGRRHFDEPGLLERHFAPARGTQSPR